MKKVIVLHGTGRSGTTVLNNLLVNHPELAWLSNYQWKALNTPIVSVLNRLVNYSVDLNDGSRSKFLIHSCNEPYDLWKKFYPEINGLDHNLSSEPFKMNNYLSKICSYVGKDVFVTKITGMARASVLQHAFKKYQVVWIDRDPRAVVLSMMKQQWFFRNKIEAFHKMTFADKITLYTAEYRRFYQSKFSIPSELRIDVQYEDLVENPVNFIRDLTKKLELGFPTQFEKIIQNWQIHSVDIEVYQQRMSHEDWAYLNEALKEDLVNYFQTSK